MLLVIVLQRLGPILAQAALSKSIALDQQKFDEVTHLGTEDWR
jgi:hypothetical protein